MPLGWLETAMVLATVVSGTIAVLALRYRGSPGAVAFSVMSACAAGWSASILFMGVVTERWLLELLQGLRFFVAAGVVAAFVVFALTHTGRLQPVPAWLVALLSIQPVASFAVLVADPTGGALVTYVEGGTVGLMATGPAILAHYLYSYVLMTVGTGLIAWELFRVEGVYRHQYALILFGISLAWGTNALILAGVLPVDLTPVAFTVTGGCFLLAIHRYDFIDLAPVARRVLVDVIDDAMVVLDDQDRVLDSNPAFRELFALEAAPSGRPVDAVLAEYPDLCAAIESDGAVPDEVKAGPYWFEVTVSPLSGGRRRADGRLVLLHDITELKEREEALARSERRYRTVAEHFPDGGIGLFDENLEYVLVNGGLFEHIEYSPGDFEGSHVEEIHTQEFVDRYAANMAAVFEGEESTIEFRHDTRYYRTQYVPIPDDEGDIHLGSALTVDITALKERERDLRHQVQQLEMMASVISHDLRNPLNVALGRTAHVIETGDTSHLSIVQQSHQRMRDIIEDVLALVRRGGEAADASDVSLANIAEMAWDHVQTGEATLAVEGDMTVHADDSRLAQLFENLYRNAVQHGRPDVAITVGTLPDGRGFYVEDDGPGIPAEERDLVLEIGHTDHDEGTGLGLTIVQSIVEGNDWSLAVAEGTDGGARFEVYTSPGGGSTQDEVAESAPE